MFFDLSATYPNYYSPMHIIPKVLIALSSFIGIILAFRLSVSISNYVILFYLANIGLFSKHQICVTSSSSPEFILFLSFME